MVSLFLVLFLTLNLGPGFAFGQAETQEKASGQTEAEKQTSGEAEKKAKISFSSTEYDFGKVFRGEKVTHTFEFKNVGEGALKVSKVKSSCGCTGALLNKEDIAPGETGQVQVNFNSAQVGSGKVKKYVSVYSNDIENNKVDVSVFGEVIEELVAKPKTLKIEPVPYGSTSSATVEVRPWSEELALEVKGVTSTNPNLLVSKWSKQSDGSYLIEVDVKQGAPTGSHGGKLIVENNSKRMPKFEIPVGAKVVGDVEVSPQSVYMWKAKASKEGRKGTVRKLILNIYNPEVSLQEVRSSPEFLKVETVQKEPKKYEIAVYLGEDAPEQIKGKLEIVTTSKQEPVVFVPVEGDLAKMAKSTAAPVTK